MGSLDNSEAFATSCGTSKWKLMKGDYNGEWSVQHWKSFKEWSLPPRSAMFFFLVDRQDMSSLHFDSVLRTFVAVNLFPKQFLHVFLIIIIILRFWQKNDQHHDSQCNIELSTLRRGVCPKSPSGCQGLHRHSPTKHLGTELVLPNLFLSMLFGCRYSGSEKERKGWSSGSAHLCLTCAF